MHTRIFSLWAKLMAICVVWQRTSISSGYLSEIPWVRNRMGYLFCLWRTLRIKCIKTHSSSESRGKHCQRSTGVIPPFLLTWCKCLGRSRKRLFSFCRLSAEHRTGQCPGTCSCWSRMTSCRPRTRPVKTKCWCYYERRRHRLRSICFLLLCRRSLTFIWQIHFSSMLKPTCSGMVWKICGVNSFFILCIVKHNIW